jgi:phosphate-selective porin OprO/OprP
MNTEQTGTARVASTWDTDALEAASTVDHDEHLGVDDGVGSGAQIQQDAAKADRVIEELDGHLKVATRVSTWDAWWDDGNAFIEHRDNFHIVSKKLGEIDLQKPQFRAKIGAKGSVDGALFDPSGLDAYDFNDGVELRRLKIYVKGGFLLAVPMSYKVQFGYGGAGFQLSDFFVRIANDSRWGNVQLGNFRAPFSVARLHSSFDYPMMEFPAPVEAFAPGYKTGYQSDWYTEKNRILIMAGIFTDSTTNDIGDATDSLGRFNARAVWRPLVRGEGKGREFLHLGLGLGWVYSGDDPVQYRSRPESFLAPRLVDTGPIDADGAGLLGVEGIWAKGSLTLMGEFIQSRVEDRATGEDLFFRGAYLAASYFLTGEVWPYDPTLGTFRSIKPARPFSPKDGGMGAWELNLRASVLDLNDGSVQGGKMDILMGGVNWHWNKHLKWLVNLGIAKVEAGDVLIGQLRLQIRY